MARSVEPFTKRVVEQYQDGFLVSCGKCEGRGGHSSSAHGACAVCGGEGTVMLDFPPDLEGEVHVVRCGLCRGTGADGGACSLCNGVGAVLREFPRVQCDACGGNGRWKQRGGRCNVCNGLGSVPVDPEADEGG